MRRTVLFLASIALAVLLVCGVALAVTRDCTTEETLCLGTPDADTLRGTKGEDKIFGLEGNDTLLGYGARDTFGGGPGDDVLSGGPGRDDFGCRLPGVDRSLGLYEGIDDGNDIVRGGDGNDEACDSVGNNRLHGQRGNDTMSGRGLVTGGPGNDWLTGREGRDTLKGGPGNDFLNSLYGRDTLSGGDGIDKMVEAVSEQSTDKYLGGKGDDHILVNNRPAFKDVVKCGPGRDRVVLDVKDVAAQDCESIRTVRAR